MMTIGWSKSVTLLILSAPCLAYGFVVSPLMSTTFAAPCTSSCRRVMIEEGDQQADEAALGRQEKWEGELSYTTSPSNLKYVDLVVGDGDAVNEGDLISVHYAGWYDKFDDVGSTDTGVAFDDSRARNAEKPLQIIYGKSPILKGWNEALRTMKVGGKRSLIIPPELGYGDIEVKAPGMPSIPASSYLRFEIELIEVDNSVLTKLRMLIPKPSKLFDKSFF